MKILRYLFITILICTAGLSIISCEEGFIPNFDDIPEIEEEETNEEDKEENSQKGGEFVLLFTNDIHSQIEPIDIRSSSDPDMGGVARIKALVDSVRTAEPAVLLTDSGDMVEGTFYFNLYSGEVEMKVLDELKYDARTIGNHDFSKKIVGLNEMFSMSKVPVVCSNYEFDNPITAGYVKKSTILKAGSVNVGIIGLNVQLEGLVDPEAYDDTQWRHAITTADLEAEKLRLQGADIVIALSHIGLYSDAVDDDRSIAMNTRYIDVILSGHTHGTALPRGEYRTNLDGKKVLIGHTGSNGRYLGYAKIRIPENGDPEYDCKLIPVDSRLDKRTDSKFVKMLDKYVEGTDMNEIIGTCPQTLNKSSNLDSPFGNLAADALIWMAKEYHGVDADVSFYNTGGIRNPMLAGECRVKDIYFSFPFDNTLTTLTIKGSELKEVFSKIANSSSLFVNGNVRLVISRYRVESLTINGEPVYDENEYKVATINYVSNMQKHGMSHLPAKESEGFITRYFVEYFRHLSAQNGGLIYYQSDGRVTYNE